MIKSNSTIFIPSPLPTTESVNNHVCSNDEYDESGNVERVQKKQKIENNDSNYNNHSKSELQDILISGSDDGKV